MKIFSLFFILIVLAGFLVHYFVFSIYEVKIVVKPEKVFADPSSKLIVAAKPINAMGWEVPFRVVKSKFKIIEGVDLVTINLIDEENGLIFLQPTGIEGKVGIYIETKYSLFPSYFEIQLLPLTV